MIHEFKSAPISVVIPCYCCTATLERAVRSIVRQTLMPHEIVLVDDFSSDETPKLLHALEKQYRDLVKIVLLTKNGGAATARNAGWMISTQPHIAFLDADDSWHMSKLELQYSLMKSRPDIALCGHQCVQSRNDEENVLPLTEWGVTHISARSMLFRNPFATSTVMLRRDIPFRFDDGRRHGEDLLLWQRIAFSGHSVVRMETPLEYVYKPFFGSGGLSLQLWKMEKAELSNLLVHYKERNIGLFMWLSSTTFSMLKFFRRAVVAKLIIR
jgi:glycosyltransferase involved in cell wall biosynthesis